MKRLLLWALLAATTAANAYRAKVYSPEVKTLQAVVNSDWLSPAIMVLGSDDVLYIDFDHLAHDYHRFTYKIEHCEDDWTPSQQLFDSDFIEGFNNNTIDDYQNSLNTTVLYTHYSMQLPNDRCRLKMSGNYRLNIYDEDQDGERVAEVCFMVLEEKMNVGLAATTNTDVDLNGKYQQLSVSLDYGNLTVTNPEEQLRLVVTQNERDDNARRDVRPNYVNAKGLRWEHNKQLIFDAGNEYHKYEILDVSHPTMGIESITWDGNNYNAYPFADEQRRNYLYDEDANGHFFIRNSDNVEIDNTCDYVFVHYKLKAPTPFDGTMSVYGLWATDDDPGAYTMTYDEADGSYNATILQKQGYYNYTYLLTTDEGTTTAPTEGNFFQTENRYQAYVYYKKTDERTWRLVGYRQLQFK